MTREDYLIIVSLQQNTKMFVSIYIYILCVCFFVVLVVGLSNVLLLFEGRSLHVCCPSLVLRFSRPASFVPYLALPPIWLILIIVVHGRAAAAAVGRGNDNNNNVDGLRDEVFEQEVRELEKALWRREVLGVERWLQLQRCLAPKRAYMQHAPRPVLPHHSC